MKDPENKRYWKLGLTAAAVIAAGLLCFFFLYRFQAVSAAFRMVVGILTPFLYGAVIAYILTPACNRIEGWLAKLFPSKKGSGLLSTLAMVLALVLALLLVWVLIMFVIPQLWNSIVTIANAAPAQLRAANAWLHDLLKRQPEMQAYWDDFSATASAKIEAWLKSGLLPAMGTLVVQLGSQLTVFIGVVKNLFLGILISIYFLSNRRQFAAQARMLLGGVFSPRWADRIEREVRYADRMFNGFLMGKLLDSAIIGAICFVGTALMRFESAALISVVVGVTNIIPFFGPFIGAIPCALLLLLENPMHCVYFLIFVVILQQLDGNVIGPRILGNTTGLSSFWVLFSILLFGGLWGIAGMIIGVPLFAVIYDIARSLIYHGLRRRDRAAMIDSYEKTFHPAPIEGEPPKKRKQARK